MRPELHETHYLGEVLGLRLLAFAYEFEVKRDAGLQEGTVVLADELPVPLRVPIVEYRHYVNVESRSSEGDRDTVSLRRYLVRTEVRERLAEALG